MWENLAIQYFLRWTISKEKIPRKLPYLVIPLTQELELLSLLVHEHPVQVASLRRPDLDGLVTPAHYLTCAYVGWNWKTS